MKLVQVQLHNFRSIIDEGMTLAGYSLIVGANNAGKSAVIDALRAFYEKDGYKFKKETDFPYVGTTDQDSWIELDFALAPEEDASLAEKYRTPDQRLRVRRYFVAASLKLKDGKTATGVILAYRTDGTLDDESFYGARNVQAGKFGDLIYIPAVSRADDHAKLSGPSALRDLLTDIMTEVAVSGSAYKTLAGNLETFRDALLAEETSDARSLTGLEGALNALLSPWGAAFKLALPAPSVPDIIKSMVTWDLTDVNHGQRQGVENFGSGFQRHFIYSLIRLRARYAARPKVPKVKDFVPELSLVLFEEPEAFLHPPQQHVLSQSLRELSESEDWQVVCATHSSNFVSRNSADLISLARLCKVGAISKVFQLSEATWTNIADANQAINLIPGLKAHADDLMPEMESVKFFLWLNSERAGAFFAEHVLLVEGPTEVALLNRLAADGSVPGVDAGLHILDCLGKYNVHRFMNLLSALGVPHSVLIDGDEGKRSHPQIAALIESSRSLDHCRGIHAFDGDIEAFLDIPKAGDPHRKPQHVMYLMETGAIAPERLEALTTIVATLCDTMPAGPSAVAKGHEGDAID